MGIMPLHLQRRFEQRWAARFGSLVIPAVERLAGRHALRPAKANEKPAGLSVKAQGNDRRQEKH
jgi:hypothetical protein